MNTISYATHNGLSLRTAQAHLQRIPKVERQAATSEWYDSQGREHLQNFAQLLTSAEKVKKKHKITKQISVDELFRLYHQGGL